MSNTKKNEKVKLKLLRKNDEIENIYNNLFKY